MPIAGRVALGGLAVLLAWGAAGAQTIPRPPQSGAGLPAAPRSAPGAKDSDQDAPGNLPAVRIGALLPLTGASAWFGKELRQGMELAITELSPKRPATARPDPGKEPKAGAAEPASATAGAVPGVTLALEALDVQPANRRQAADEFARLAALPVPVVFTASPTPTAVLEPLAAARDVLLVYQGAVTGRPVARSRLLVDARPSLAARVGALVAYATEHDFRRLAVVAAGDDFGKAVRAGLGSGWHQAGRSLAEESLTLDAPDLPGRLRQLVRRAPQAVVLGFRGADLGDLARRLREAGYAGPLLLLDDDPVALLAGGVALQDAAVFADAFVPEPGSAGERFATAYAQKFGGPPSRYAATGYESVRLVAAGIRAAMAEKPGVPGGARLRDTLRALHPLPSIFGGEVVLRDDGTLTRPLALFTVDAGALAFVRFVTPAGPS